MKCDRSFSLMHIVVVVLIIFVCIMLSLFCAWVYITMFMLFIKYFCVFLCFLWNLFLVCCVVDVCPNHLKTNENMGITFIIHLLATWWVCSPTKKQKAMIWFKTDELSLWCPNDDWKTLVRKWHPTKTTITNKIILWILCWNAQDLP